MATKSEHSKSQHSKSEHSGGEHLSKTTTNHEEIRKWAEARGGKPASVQGTGGKKDVGIIRLMFPSAPGAHDDKLQEIDWDEFFEKFDDQGLAFVYQEHTADGEESNFNKLVSRKAN